MAFEQAPGWCRACRCEVTVPRERFDLQEWLNTYQGGGWILLALWELLGRSWKCERCGRVAKRTGPVSG
jgi:hypothetical protein